MAENPARAIEPDEAHMFAAATQHVVTAGKLFGVGALANATLEPAPTTIFDVSGAELFHDFTASSGDGVAGTIRAAATSALGAPIVSISGGAPGWDERSALRLATEQLHATNPQARVTGSRLVCYAYPKIGIELSYEVPGAAPATELFDASSGNVVGTSERPDDQFTRYSLLSHIEPDRESRLQAFAGIEATLHAVRAAQPAPQAGVSIHPPFPIIRLKSGMVNLSPYCGGSPPGNSHYAQITDYFCVDASAQMLMEHYGWNYTQNQIATAMGTSAAQGGTTGAGLTSGFASLTHNQFTLTFDDSKTRDQQYADAVAEVDANRPVFTQVPHHYRVCMGYSEILFGGRPLDRQLYIYDPWPWNADLCHPGAPYWESWSTSPVMWFGIVHHV